MRTSHNFDSRLIAFAFTILGFAPNVVLLAGDPVNADILFVGGTLHLGEGKPAQKGDVAVVDGKIEAVGTFEHGQIKRRVNCDGLIICPGFIDLHSHSDGPATRKETRLVANFLTQGCTTVVTGNCGSGPIDVEAYYAKLDDYGVGVNVAHLLPQGSLRRKVLQSERRKATPSELEQMKLLAEKAMEDGAWGMSTGLIYVPSSYANTDELTEIAIAISRHGGIYASHIRNEGTGLLDAVNEAVEIGRGANIPVHISHFKSSGKDSWGTSTSCNQRNREAPKIRTANHGGPVSLCGVEHVSGGDLHSCMGSGGWNRKNAGTVEQWPRYRTRSQSDSPKTRVNRPRTTDTDCPLSTGSDLGRTTAERARYTTRS